MVAPALGNKDCAAHNLRYTSLENFESRAFAQGFLNHLETRPA
jgi:hypothetical protein